MLPLDILMTAQAHLDQLIAARAQEGPRLDFKRELPAAWDDKSKVKFVADILAFANAGGGDIVFGVDEDADAQASALIPQVLSSADEEVRRIQDFTLNLVEPRLPGVQVFAVPVAVGAKVGYAVVVRIPQSWAGPIGPSWIGTSTPVMVCAIASSMCRRSGGCFCAPKTRRSG